MSNKLTDVLSQIKHQEFATRTGREIHKRMQHIVISSEQTSGDADLVAKISQNTKLARFFGPNAKTEVPIAGIVNNRFISRRLDRLVVAPEQKQVYVLDYKSDTDKTALFDKYVAQINEYKSLLRDIYPGYQIIGYILWLHDFELQEI